MGDFSEDAANKLSKHAASLVEDKNGGGDGGVFDTEEIKRLMKIAKVRKRKRLVWFKSIDGSELRFTVTGNSPVKGKGLLFCPLCGHKRGVWSEQGYFIVDKFLLPLCQNRRWTPQELLQCMA